MDSTTDAAANGPAATEQKPEMPVVAEPSDAPQDAAEQEKAAASAEEEAAAGGLGGDDSKKYPGWPGYSVFRLIVPVLKVGSIIGRKGELIKKMCEETKARIRILDGPLGSNDRIVLITGKEEPEAEISPAMNATLRVFKRVSGISDGEGDTAVQPVCLAKLLVASTQAINLIGKGGTTIKSIQETSTATIRVLSGDELPHYAVSDERVVDIQGEYPKVLKALELVVGHLRKFLVDQSVIPLFEKNLSAASAPAPAIQDRVADPWADKTQSSIHVAPSTGLGSDYPLSLKRDSLYLDRDSHIDSHIPRSGLSLYGQDPALSGLRSSGLGRSAGALVTQITQTMQVPLSYAEDIIGIGGANIAYIRRTSGAILTVQESRGLPDEITVEIKGTSTQVQTAQQLIQDFIAGHKEPGGGGYGGLDSGYASSYSQLGSASYPSSQSLGGYGSSGLGGYGSYRY